MTLRVFHSGRVIEYSDKGDLVSGGPPGPWTLDAFVVVKGIKAKGKQLVVSCKRLYYVDLWKGRHFTATAGPKVKVRIEIDPTTATALSAEKALSRIFAPQGENIADLVPDYWKPFLLNPDASLSQLIMKVTSRWQAADPELSGDPGWRASLRYRASGRNPEKIAGLIYPEPLSHNEPRYTPEARAAKYQGTVLLLALVERTGTVKDVVITHPIGMGLDDAAVNTVKMWRFRPATLNGSPVSLPVSVNITFRLF